MPTYTNAYIKGQKSILDVQQENLRNDLQKFAARFDVSAGLVAE